MIGQNQVIIIIYDAFNISSQYSIIPLTIVEYRSVPIDDDSCVVQIWKRGIVYLKIEMKQTMRC